MRSEAPGWDDQDVPEMPEVTAAAVALDAALEGKVVAKVEPASFALVKSASPPLESLVGRRYGGSQPRGKHVCIGRIFDGQYFDTNRSKLLHQRRPYAAVIRHDHDATARREGYTCALTH